MALSVNIRHLGPIPYRDALAQQTQARERVMAGEPDELLLLEHVPPVVTLGRRGGLVDRTALAGLDTEVIETDRGGLATWHGPGQLVGYPILDLRRRGMDVGGIVRHLGETMRASAEAFGVGDVWYDDSRPGIYVGRPGMKLGSIGLHIHRGVTTHGFALNVSCGLEGFQAIEPCGDATLQLTTILRQTGTGPTVVEVAERAAALFVEGLSG